MSLAGTVLRSTAFRPGRTWRIPAGLHRGLRVEIERQAPLHTYLGTLEIELARHVRKMVTPGITCLDIGAHDALDALTLARLSGSRVLAFEFDAARLQMMRRNLTLNPEIAERVRIVETYVAFETVADPPADTLDRLVARHLDGACPGFIKMDVEGAEMSVLTGARKVLETRPHLIVETHSEELERECGETLRRAGYTPTIVNRRRWVPEHRGGGHNRWLVALGSPAESEPARS